MLAGSRERRAASDADLAERRSLLEKARQAERLTGERVAAQARELWKDASAPPLLSSAPRWCARNSCSRDMVRLP